jgi:hypothetical protein
VFDGADQFVDVDVCLRHRGIPSVRSVRSITVRDRLGNPRETRWSVCTIR